MKIGFSINEYDKDGDVYDKCVKLYCGDNTILKFDSINKLMTFARGILGMELQI